MKQLTAPTLLVALLVAVTVSASPSGSLGLLRINSLRQKQQQQQQPVGDVNPSSSFPPEGMTYNKTVWTAFAAKTLLNPVEMKPLEWNPYTANLPNQSWPDTVCAVQYPDPSNRSAYYLRNFTTRAEAEAQPGTFVTHQHPCGMCSTTKDLATYMALPDLTKPARQCGLDGLLGNWTESVECMHQIGFTRPCALIWARDAWNSARHCFGICIEALVEKWPNNIPANSTIMNPCISCDEYKSGPWFKIFAARTRRDSGLKSLINRPPGWVYSVVHDYY